MKIEITNDRGDDNKLPNTPFLVKHRETKNVFYVYHKMSDTMGYNEYKGICVYSEHIHYLGDNCSLRLTEVFQLFTGTISLTND